jgi:hypothetical protein
MFHIWSLWARNPPLRKKLKLYDIWPTDEMELKPIQNLFKELPEFHPFITSTEEKRAVEYLENVKNYHNYWENDEMRYDHRLSDHNSNSVASIHLRKFLNISLLSLEQQESSNILLRPTSDP